MSTPTETAEKLVGGVAEFLHGDVDYKIAVGGEVVDQLFGTDPHALVDNIPGLSPEMSEQVFDWLKTQAVQKLQERVGP